MENKNLFIIKAEGRCQQTKKYTVTTWFALCPIPEFVFSESGATKFTKETAEELLNKFQEQEEFRVRERNLPKKFATKFELVEVSNQCT